MAVETLPETTQDPRSVVHEQMHTLYYVSAKVRAARDLAEKQDTKDSWDVHFLLDQAYGELQRIHAALSDAEPHIQVTEEINHG